MSVTILAGFVPLVDAAVLVAAREQGFARECGYELQLVKEPSWANLRDHLNLGHIDCAHALAPLPIAAALGIGQVRASLAVPFVLGRGGNAITVSVSLAQRMRSAAHGDIHGAKASGTALAQVVRASDTPLTLAMVYPFSGHNFEIRYWLAAAGIHPDKDVRLVAIPPPLMVESLRAGYVDGFCVGEPWNSVAVAQGLGEIVATKAEIFPRGIEKVLAVRDSQLADRARLHAMLESLDSAAAWCDDAQNHQALAQLLARPEYLDMSPELIMRSLNGSVGAAEDVCDEDFLYFARHGANRPLQKDALWIYAQMRRWGQLPMNDRSKQLVAGVFRSDLYDIVFPNRPATIDAPINACDGIEFEGDSIREYLAQFSMTTPFASSSDMSS